MKTEFLLAPVAVASFVSDLIILLCMFKLLPLTTCLFAIHHIHIMATHIVFVTVKMDLLSPTVFGAKGECVQMTINE